MNRFLPTISISMLDLITNALAAMLILFLIVASFRPPAPAPRARGTMVVRGRLEDPASPPAGPSRARVTLWVETPRPKPHPERFFGERIREIHEARGLTVQGEEFEPIVTSLTVEGFTAPVMVYASPGSPNEQVAVVRDPYEGKWEVGVLYREHLDIEDGERPTEARLRVWYSLEGGATLAGEDRQALVSPTTAMPRFVQVGRED